MPRPKKIVGLSILSAVALLAVFLFSDIALAHPGNTAADGCHYCRTNCTKWGVPWNERHCHGGSTTPAPTPTPTPKPITKPATDPTPTLPAPINTSANNVKTDISVDGRIKGKINEVKTNYPLHHQGFRESLLQDIVNMVGSDADIDKIGYFVYTILPDVKNIVTDGDKFICDCSKTCPNISTCEEAQYQLNTCGCTIRDADHDGIACDNECQ